MTATVTQKGQTLIIVGTSLDIVDALVTARYPRPVAMHFEASGSIYHVIAIKNP